MVQRFRRYIAAADQHDDIAAGDFGGTRQQARDGNARSTLDSTTLAAQVKAHGRYDLILVNDDPFVNDRLVKWKRDGVRFDAARGAVGQCWFTGHLENFTGLDRPRHYRRRDGLATDDADPGVVVFQNTADAADESAATDSDKDNVYVRKLPEYLDADRSLAGDNLLVVLG